MPGSSLWREPALQAGPAGVRAASSSSSTAATGQRYPRGPSEVTLGTRWVCPCPQRQFHTNSGSGQSTRGLNALQNLISTYPESERQKAKHQEPTRVCSHKRSSPTFQPSRVQQARGSFLSSLGNDAETCFAGTAAFALPAFSRQQGSASAPQPKPVGA